MSELHVIKSKRSGFDANACCTANRPVENSYVLLTFRGGRLSGREILPSNARLDVESRMASFRGSVYADDRRDANLLPLRPPRGAKPVDFATFRRAKSDEEAVALDNLYRKTEQILRAADDTSSFRGAGDSFGKTAFTKTQFSGFTQYRGGIKDAHGRMSDLTRIEPMTPEWDTRMKRVYRGLDYAKKYVRDGSTIDTVNACVRAFLDPEKDVMYGDAVNHTGFEGHEALIGDRRICKFDYMRTGMMIGDKATGEVAAVFRGAAMVGDNETGTVATAYRSAADSFRGTLCGRVSQQDRSLSDELVAANMRSRTAYNQPLSKVQQSVWSNVTHSSTSSHSVGDVVDEYFRGVDDMILASKETFRATPPHGVAAPVPNAMAPSPSMTMQDREVMRDALPF
jgi:hypothetical protein